MPTFAWLIADGKGKAVMSQPLPHTCFAQVPGFGMRRTSSYDQSCVVLAPNKYILYASCHGSYEDAVLYAEKVNESVLKKYPFIFKAHPHTEEGNPFGDARWKTPPSPGYGPCLDVSYWSVEWEVGTQWDLVYAVTKLLFKNITYGNRTNCGDTHAGMMSILRQGGNVFEAMIYSSQYLSNGYGYPRVFADTATAKEVYKFTQEGPDFTTGDWSSNKLGDGQNCNLNGNHNAIKRVSKLGASVTVGGVRQTATIQQLRTDLRKAAGIPDGSVPD